MRNALQSVREHQGTQLHWDVKKNECDKEKNYFLKVLGVDGWKSLIMEFLNRVRASFPFACLTNFGPFKHIVVRGNTLSVLCNLVQQYVIDTLEQAVLLAVHRTSESNEYPILKKVDILLALRLAQHMAPRRKNLRINAHREQFNSETVTTECRNKIVNHLTRMAGATILEYGTNELIWQKTMEIMYALIPYPRDRFFERNVKFSVYAGCSKDDIDLHNDLPPIRLVDGCATSTIVPREIEDSADRLGLSYDRIYGSCWLVSEGHTLEEEIDAAKEEYFFKEGDTVFSESEDETSTGSMSISDEDSCDDYSVYSDNTCPDE